MQELKLRNSSLYKRSIEKISPNVIKPLKIFSEFLDYNVFNFIATEIKRFAEQNICGKILTRSSHIYRFKNYPCNRYENL